VCSSAPLDLAPEGWSVDDRADLFSVGSILFEMVTRQRAFARETTIRRVATLFI
jgi:hypothetical protein